MKERLDPGRCSWNVGQRLGYDTNGAQIVEFAVSLPLLVVFVVGIFDFSGAFTLKQKLTNAAREGARVAAADPANDLGSAIPVSVSDAFQAVDNYLLSQKLNDCGVTGATPTNAKLAWTYAASSAGPPTCTVTVKIDRGCWVTTATASGPVDVVNTCVTLQYAYHWQFGRVVGLLNGSFSGPAELTATAVAMNEN